MQAANPNCNDASVLILAPIGNDARNAADVLAKVRIRAEICGSIQELCRRGDAKAGAYLISEEVFNEAALHALLQSLERQPVWSDIPIVLLTAGGEIRQRTYNILNFLGPHGNVTLLEKPLRAVTLISVIRASLRSRDRQYEVRDLLENYSAAVRDQQAAAAKFRAVFEQSAVFACIMALDGTVLEANRLCLAVCGYQPEEVIGRFFWDCPWWRGSAKVQNKLKAGAAQATQGTPYLEDLDYLWADGSEHVVEFGLFPIRDDGGRVIFLHPTGADITERTAALARAEFLSRLTQKLSMVSDPDEINRVATGEMGRFLRADRCYFFQSTRKAEQVRVLPDWHRDGEASIAGVYRLADFGPPEWWAAAQEGLMDVSDIRTRPDHREFATSHPGFNVLSYVMAPFVHEGKWVAAICLTNHIPRVWEKEEKALIENAVARVWPLVERAKAEAALREANSLLSDKAAHLETLVQERTGKLRETIGDLEAFSYSIAHDMRAPLRSLQGFSEILLTDHREQLNEEGRHLLDRIRVASVRMDKLIQDVLNYSRIMRADFPLESVDVVQLLRGIIDSYPSLAPDKVDITLIEPIPPVLGNEAMLTQIFSNLMGNAVKFVTAGTRPRLRVWAEPHANQVRLLVEDNGIGISSEQHEKIFGIFQQVSKDYEGTGIGLAISKKAVERMGGVIGVQSELGQGSKFWIELQRPPALEKAK